MAGESNAKMTGTIILSIAMMAFALAFYVMDSVMYLLLAFISVVLALMVGGSFISSDSSKTGK